MGKIIMIDTSHRHPFFLPPFFITHVYIQKKKRRSRLLFTGWKEKEVCLREDRWGKLLFDGITSNRKKHKSTKYIYIYNGKEMKDTFHMAHDCQLGELDFFEKRYCKLNRIFLSLIGLWPYSPRKKRFFRMLIVNCTFLFILVIQVNIYNLNHFVCVQKIWNFDIRSYFQITLIITVDNLELLMEVITNFVLYLTCALMYYNSLLNMPKV